MLRTRSTRGKRYEIQAPTGSGLWSRTTTVSEAGFERRATYAECVRDFGKPA